MPLKSRRSKMGNLVLLLGLVLIMGSSTSASNALSSSSSFTTKNGKTAFTKHNGYSHFQDNNNSNGQAEDPVAANGNSANGQYNNNNANGSNGVNGNDQKNGHAKTNGVGTAFLPRNNNGKREPDPIVEADFIADTKLPT